MSVPQLAAVELVPGAVDRPLLVLGPSLGTLVSTLWGAAAQRLGQQRPRHGRVMQRRGMELDELGVSDRHPGAQRHRNAVPRGFGGIGGDRVQLARAAGRNEHVRSSHLGPRARLVEGDDAPARALLDEEVEREPAFVDGDGRGAHGVDQRSFDLRPGRGTAGVHDTSVRVPTLPGELEPALLSDRERQILACVARGLGDREIAEQLVLSPHTVHRHPSTKVMRPPLSTSQISAGALLAMTRKRSSLSFNASVTRRRPRRSAASINARLTTIGRRGRLFLVT